MKDFAPTPRQETEVVIVGGGQAGLSASAELLARGIPHVVLEKDVAFRSWKRDRWDSFCLVTPNWQCRLPGHPYDGDDPDGFMLKDEITDYLDRFRARHDFPLHEGVTVTRVARDGAAWKVETDRGDWIAGQVVIATGGYDEPITPPYARALDPSITQMHSRDYRRPSQLPEGATLIVGTGQSGVQLMEDLVRDGRQVHLAVGPAPRSPRKYRGRDATDWLHDMGHYAMTIREHPDPEAAVHKTNHYMSGRDGGKEIDLRRWHLDHGVELWGSLTGMDGTALSFAPDLAKNLDDADASYLGIREAIDGWIAAQGIDAPEEPPFEKLWAPAQERIAADAAALGITSVLWCIGFRPDYAWIEADVFDAKGRPVYDRGVTAAPGLHFLGLGWLNTWGSGRFLGIAEDAAFLADRIAERAARAPARTGTGA
ncbi:MSMEG_0569 family flavin-dependent oxidoreductase [Rhodovulum sp. DZ06]|uniref:MSMEG_0569 family flavin-dependent oxidoreductase n=1 Tax=Rhodovulum sp. DZ06 TaxID=3425126 RepID=UPI003D350BE6